MRESEPLIAMRYIGVMDASASPEVNVFVAPCACRIVGVWLVDGTAKTGHADNKGTYVAYNKTTGAGAVVVASRVTDTPTDDNIVANVGWSLDLSTTLSALNMSQGQVLSFKATEAGTATSGDLVTALVGVAYVPGTGKTR